MNGKSAKDIFPNTFFFFAWGISSINALLSLFLSLFSTNKQPSLLSVVPREAEEEEEDGTGTPQGLLSLNSRAIDFLFYEVIIYPRNEFRVLDAILRLERERAERNRVEATVRVINLYIIYVCITYLCKNIYVFFKNECTQTRNVMFRNRSLLRRRRRRRASFSSSRSRRTRKTI
jgi:hypothetical protein